MALFSIKKETLENMASALTQKEVTLSERLKQKKTALINRFKLVKKFHDKINKADELFTEKLGTNYTKLRNTAKIFAKFYLACRIGPTALVCLGMHNAVKAVSPLLKNAEEARQKNQVTGLFDYVKKNGKETALTLASASFGVGAITFGLMGLSEARFIARSAATGLVLVPEIKNLKTTINDITSGKKDWKQAFKDFGRDSLTVMLSIGTFILTNGQQLGEHGLTTPSLDQDIGSTSKPDDAKKDESKKDPATAGNTQTNAGNSGNENSTQTNSGNTGSDKPASPSIPSQAAGNNGASSSTPVIGSQETGKASPAAVSSIIQSLLASKQRR